MTNWFVIRSATRQERKAATALREAGFVAYCPIATRWERTGARKMVAKRYSAYLEGYMFAQVPDGQFAAVEAVEGVHGVLRYTNAAGLRCPRAVPGGLVEAIQEAELRGEFDKTIRITQTYPIGAIVRVTSGPFEHLIGEITQQRGAQRVKVLMDAIQRGAPVKAVEIDIEQLEAVA